MNESTASIRLKHFMDYKGMTSSQFADSCGIPRPTLSQLLSGRNKKLSDQVLKPIHARFPELSLLWLMFGEGEMLTGSVIPQEGFQSEESSEHKEDTKFVATPVGDSDEDEAIYYTGSSVSGKKIHDLRSDGNPPAPLRRSVRSVVVYYDDNTYETFVPGENGLSFP